MAIFGIGARYEKDVSNDFILEECACIGWTQTEAGSLYEMLRRIKKGDIIYIKSYDYKNGTVLILSLIHISEPTRPY